MKKLPAFVLASVSKLKYLLLFPLFAVLLWQCSKSNVLEPIEDHSTVSKKIDEFSVPLKDAAKIATNAIALTQQNSKNKNARYTNTSGEIPFLEENREVESQRTVKDEEGDLYHIINYKDKKGFVILAADRRVFPILAYSEKNSFTDENLPGVKIWFGVAKEHMKIAIKKDKIDDGIKNLWDILEGKTSKKNARGTTGWCDYWYTYVSTGNYVDAVAQWNQSGSAEYYNPYDNSCGSCSKRGAGCGPIAMGMIMRYLRYPDFGTICVGANCFTPSVANWNTMEYGEDWNCNPSSSPMLNRAILVRAAGIASSSIYMGNCSTATPPWTIDDTFVNFFNFSSGGSWSSLSGVYSTVKSELNNYHPVMFYGTTSSFGLADQHLWVGDGYSTLDTQWHIYVGCDENGDNCIEDCRSLQSEWIGMNWGWGGDDNGMFYTTYSFPVTGGYYDSYLHALVGIRSI
jgi:hypothetical protein